MKKRITIAVSVVAMIAGMVATAGAAPLGPDPISNILEKLDQVLAVVDQVLAVVGQPPSWDQTLPSSTRFIVLSNMNGDAVLDRETGLVWEKSPDAELQDAQNNHRRCNNMSLGNRKGWRVPTIQELASLVDGDPANTSYPRLPLGHPFTNVQSDFPYRSATSVFDGQWQWVLNFGISDGIVAISDKSPHMYVWCVRGGQGPDTQVH